MGVDQGDVAAPSLSVQRKCRYRRSFVAGILIMHHFFPGFNEMFGIHVNTQKFFIFPYMLDTYDVLT